MIRGRSPVDYGLSFSDLLHGFLGHRNEAEGGPCTWERISPISSAAFGRHPFVDRAPLPDPPVPNHAGKARLLKTFLKGAKAIRVPPAQNIEHGDSEVTLPKLAEPPEMILG